MNYRNFKTAVDFAQTDVGQQAIGTATKVAKGLIIGVGAVVAFMFVRKQIKKIKEGSTDRQLQQSIDNLTVKTSNLTIQADTATSYAKQLYTAMKGAGTNETTIEEILLNKLKTKDDWTAVVKAFGTPDYGVVGGSSWFSSENKLDLAGWLREECSSGLLSRLQQRVSDLKVEIAI